MKKIYAGVTVLFCVLLLSSVPVYASQIREPENMDGVITNEVDGSQTDRFGTTSPWLKGNEDESIYSNPLEGSDETDVQISPDTPGTVEKHISTLLRNIASSLIELLSKNLGASLDSIVYGRVGSGHPNRVNIFSFELRQGNPYGVTGAVAYSVIRSIAYIFMALQFIYTLAKASFSGYTSKSREEIKGRFYTLILNFCLLALMPFFLDIVLYLRDVVLYGLKEVTSQLITGGGSFNLSDAFYIVSENSGTFVDAVMYMGTVILTVYFACIYVSVAMDMLVCFVIFPFSCVLSRQSKSSLEVWCVSILSDICTPVLDAVLLLVPLLTSVMLSDVIPGVRIIQLIMCMLIIPLRGQLKEKLGLSRSGERNGMFGAMAGIAAGRLLGRRLKAGIGRLKDAYSDLQRSREHEEREKLDKEEEDSLLAGYNSRRTASSGIAGAFEEESGLEEGMREASGGAAGNRERTIDRETAGYADPGRTDEESPESENVQRAAIHTAPPRSREEAARELQDAIEAKEEEIADMRVEKAGYLQKEKEQRLAMLTGKNGDKAYKQAQENAAEYALKASETDLKIQEAGKELSQLKKQAELMSGPGTGSRRRRTDFDARRAELLEKQANINNFEQPEFRGVLSNAKMKELYRARALRSGMQAAAGAAGAVGGSVLLGSMGSFMPPSTAMLMTAGGAAAGSAIAEAGVSAITEGIRVLNRSGTGGPERSRTVRETAEHVPSGTAHPQQPEPVRHSPDIPVAEVPEQAHVQTETEQIIPPENAKAIQLDAVRTLNRMISRDGEIQNSQIMRALKEANLQVEAYFASLDDESRASVTQEIEQDYRIEAQTQTIVNTLLNRLVLDGKYEKGSADYKYAKEFLLERVEKIVEENNQSLL